jgi:uncharacterized membrane protein YbhN (UPF0104 family)
MAAIFRIAPQTIVKALIRLGLSAVALWWVSRKIDFPSTLDLMKSLNWTYAIPAVLAFIISHLVSAERIRRIWSAAFVRLKPSYVLRLYWMGMFYSLFLPGGIGGDGYKVYILRRYAKLNLGNLVRAGILDRGAGMACIGWISLFISVFLLDLPQPWESLGYVGLVIFFPVFWLVMRLFFNLFLKIYAWVLSLSMLKQGLQATSASLLVLAMGQEFVWSYPLAFLLSSLSLLLPISIGGLGARELVLNELPESFAIDYEVATAMSLSFFAINVMVSLMGAAVKVLPVETEEENSEE